MPPGPCHRPMPAAGWTRGGGSTTRNGRTGRCGTRPRGPSPSGLNQPGELRSPRTTASFDAAVARSKRPGLRRPAGVPDRTPPAPPSDASVAPACRAMVVGLPPASQEGPPAGAARSRPRPRSQARPEPHWTHGHGLLRRRDLRRPDGRPPRRRRPRRRAPAPEGPVPAASARPRRSRDGRQARLRPRTTLVHGSSSRACSGRLARGRALDHSGRPPCRSRAMPTAGVTFPSSDTGSPTGPNTTLACAPAAA